MSKHRIVGVIVLLLCLPAVAVFGEETPPPKDDDLIPLKRTAPQYPRQALVNGIEGMVRVGGTVAPDGSVAKVHVVVSRPAGLFDAAALHAVKQWKFKPRIVDGVAVEREFEQTINFQLDRGDGPDPLVVFVTESREQARALYREQRSLCPDVYRRAEDAANTALGMSIKVAHYVADLPEMPEEQKQAVAGAYLIRNVNNCLFSSWEQLSDPDVYSLAARAIGFERSAVFAEDSARALEAVAVQKRATPGATPPSPEQLLQVRSWLFKRMVPAYYELINVQSAQFPPAPAAGKAAADALDRARAASGAGRSKETRSILVKALKKATEPVDRGLLLLALARANAALNDADAALESLSQATEIEGLPWNIVLTAEMARATLCGRTGNAECFEKSRAKLHAELGVAEKFVY